MLDKKMYLSLLGLLCLVATANGQTDTTDLSFYSESAVIETLQDSILYSDSTHTELILEFDIDDLENMGKLHLELGAGNRKQVIFHKHYTESQLSSLGLLDGNSVTVSFDNQPKGICYRASVVIEDQNGLLKNTIHKTLTP